MGCSPVGQASRSSQHGSVVLCDPLAALESIPHTGEGESAPVQNSRKHQKITTGPGSHIAIVLALPLTN